MFKVLQKVYIKSELKEYLQKISINGRNKCFGMVKLADSEVVRLHTGTI